MGVGVPVYLEAIFCLFFLSCLMKLLPRSTVRTPEPCVAREKHGSRGKQGKSGDVKEGAAKGGRGAHVSWQLCREGAMQGVVSQADCSCLFVFSTRYFATHSCLGYQINTQGQLTNPSTLCGEEETLK